jgi:hypothetical protein
MIAAILLAALAAGARAERVGRVVRSDLPISVSVHGTVIASEPARVKADFDGRIEEVHATPSSWSLAGAPLAYLASPEMAAMLDSHSTTIRETIEKRWQNVYRLQPIACAADCWVMHAYVKNKQMVAARTLMFEVSEPRLVGHVRPEDAHWIRAGQTVEFWVAGDPKKRYRARVQRYSLDVPIPGGEAQPREGTVSEPRESGATFATTLSPGNFLPPGTKWEGRVIPSTRKRAFLAPTEALIEYKGALYLPVRVSTGVTTPDVTEVVEGIDHDHDVLVIDEQRFQEAHRYRQTADQGEIYKRIYPQGRAPAPVESSPEPTTSVRREQPSFVPSKERGSDAMPDPDATYSETPYDR